MLTYIILSLTSIKNVTDLILFNFCFILYDFTGHEILILLVGRLNLVIYLLSGKIK